MKTMLFNPYTGTPRHPSDIASDPEGISIMDPEATTLEAYKAPAVQPERKPCEVCAGTGFLAGRFPGVHYECKVCAIKAQPATAPGLWVWFEAWFNEFHIEELTYYHPVRDFSFAAWQAATDAALERAALVCDEQAKEPECPERATYCAAAIRALKEQK